MGLCFGYLCPETSVTGENRNLERVVLKNVFSYKIFVLGDGWEIYSGGYKVEVSPCGC